MDTPKKEKDKSKSSMVLPIAIAALGVAAVFTLLYLLSDDDAAEGEEDVDGIENYDLVKGAPFIFAQE